MLFTCESCEHRPAFMAVQGFYGNVIFVCPQCRLRVPYRNLPVLELLPEPEIAPRPEVLKVPASE